MRTFGLLLGLAFVDLGIAGFMASRGDRGIALLFMLLAVVTAGFALASVSSVRRNPRGRLEAVEPPFAKVLGFAGAVAILGAAAYVATVTTSPRGPKVAPVPAEARPRAVATPAPRPVPRRVPVATNLLYKCEDASGAHSFQSQPCAAGSRQVWAREVTPEPEPTPAQRARLRRERQWAPPATSSGGGWSAYEQDDSTGERSAACRSARAADAAYRRRPLSQVTHEGLRRHGDAIQRACY
jgi:hypothetical protein